MEQYFFDIDSPVTAATQQVERLQQQQEQDEQVHKQQDQQSLQQEAGIHMLRLLVQLTPLPGTIQQQRQQQQLDQQELLLWTSAWQETTGNCSVSNSSGGITTSNTSSSSSSSSSKPPWPEDTADPQLCEMVLLPQPGTGPSSRSSSQRCVKLPGGMCLLPAAGAAVTADGVASAAVLAGLFRDLEGLGSSQQNFHDTDDNMNGAMNGDVSAGMNGNADGGAVPQQQQQQQQQLEVVQWGDWVPVLQQVQQQAVPKAGRAMMADKTALAQQQMLPPAAVATAAGLLLQVWQLQQQAEQLNKQGDAAAAVRLCQAALAAADGATPSPAVHLAPATTAVAGAAAEEVPTQQQQNMAALVCSSAQAGGVVLGRQHVLRLRVLAALLCAAVGAAEWQVALQAARQLVAMYELVYPKVRETQPTRCCLLHHACCGNWLRTLLQCKTLCHDGPVRDLCRLPHARLLQPWCARRSEPGWA
jgi:hypothetical protein